MKPGRELDALVADKIFGNKHNGDSETEWAWWKTLPNYSTDIAAAWDVAQRFPNFGIMHDPLFECWICRFRDEKADYESRADSAPHAICLAALKAVGF